MNHISTILVKYGDLSQISALCDHDIIDIFEKISGPSRFDPEIVEAAHAKGFQVAGFADADLDHVYVLRDGMMCEVVQELANFNDLRLIADVMRARGTHSRIDGSGRGEKSHVQVDRASWLGSGIQEAANVTLVVDHSFAAEAFGSNIGQQIMNSVESLLKCVVTQAGTAENVGLVKPELSDGAALAMGCPGIRKPLHIAAITPSDRSDVIITSKDRSWVVRPYEPGLADLWVAKALNDGPRKELTCSILASLHKADMKILSNILLMHGYTLLDGDRVMRPHLWNKVNWGAK